MGNQTPKTNDNNNPNLLEQSKIQQSGSPIKKLDESDSNHSNNHRIRRPSSSTSSIKRTKMHELSNTQTAKLKQFDQVLKQKSKLSSTTITNLSPSSPSSSRSVLTPSQILCNKLQPIFYNLLALASTKAHSTYFLPKQFFMHLQQIYQSMFWSPIDQYMIIIELMNYLSFVCDQSQKIMKNSNKNKGKINSKNSGQIEQSGSKWGQFGNRINKILRNVQYSNRNIVEMLQQIKSKQLLNNFTNSPKPNTQQSISISTLIQDQINLCMYNQSSLIFLLTYLVNKYQHPLPQVSSYNSTQQTQTLMIQQLKLIKQQLQQNKNILTSKYKDYSTIAQNNGDKNEYVQQQLGPIVYKFVGKSGKYMQLKQYLDRVIQVIKYNYWSLIQICYWPCLDNHGYKFEVNLATNIDEISQEIQCRLFNSLSIPKYQQKQQQKQQQNQQQQKNTKFIMSTPQQSPSNYQQQQQQQQQSSYLSSRQPSPKQQHYNKHLQTISQLTLHSSIFTPILIIQCKFDAVQHIRQACQSIKIIIDRMYKKVDGKQYTNYISIAKVKDEIIQNGRIVLVLRIGQVVQCQCQCQVWLELAFGRGVSIITQFVQQITKLQEISQLSNLYQRMHRKFMYQTNRISQKISQDSALKSFIKTIQSSITLALPNKCQLLPSSILSLVTPQNIVNRLNKIRDRLKQTSQPLLPKNGRNTLPAMVCYKSLGMLVNAYEQLQNNNNNNNNNKNNNNMDSFDISYIHHIAELYHTLHCDGQAYQYVKAIQDKMKQCSVGIDDEVKNYVLVGDCLVGVGQYSQAIAIYEKLISKVSVYTQLHIQLTLKIAQVCMLTFNPQKCLTILQPYLSNTTLSLASPSTYTLLLATQAQTDHQLGYPKQCYRHLAQCAQLMDRSQSQCVSPWQQWRRGRAWKSMGMAYSNIQCMQQATYCYQMSRECIGNCHGRDSMQYYEVLTCIAMCCIDWQHNQTAGQSDNNKSTINTNTNTNNNSNSISNTLSSSIQIDRQDSILYKPFCESQPQPQLQNQQFIQQKYTKTIQQCDILCSYFSTSIPISISSISHQLSLIKSHHLLKVARKPKQAITAIKHQLQQLQQLLQQQLVQKSSNCCHLYVYQCTYLLTVAAYASIQSTSFCRKMAIQGKSQILKAYQNGSMRYCKFLVGLSEILMDTSNYDLCLQLANQSLVILAKLSTQHDHQQYYYLTLKCKIIRLHSIIHNPSYRPSIPNNNSNNNNNNNNTNTKSTTNNITKQQSQLRQLTLQQQYKSRQDTLYYARTCQLMSILLQKCDREEQAKQYLDIAERIYQQNRINNSNNNNQNNNKNNNNNNNNFKLSII